MAESPSTASSASPRRPVYRARVERIFDHNADTRSLFLNLLDGRRLHFVPGQFISISLPLESGTRVRPYTIASSPEQTDAIEICFNELPGGTGVRHLFERQVGDELEFTGPFGAFTIDRPPAGHCVFIAEGTAIAPIRPMVTRLIAVNPRPALSFLYGAPDPDHLLYGEEAGRWISAGVEFIPLLAPAADLYDCLAAEAQRRWVEADSDRSRHFFVCGVGKGVIRLRDLLRGAGYERRAVHYEQW
jgi:glycine betaine catabolism B